MRRRGLTHENHRLRLIGGERNFAVTAIAAASAFLAEVVSAGILRATGADARGFFFADITKKWHDVFVRTYG
jgi:hypothetical protein